MTYINDLLGINISIESFSLKESEDAVKLLVKMGVQSEVIEGNNL